MIGDPFDVRGRADPKCKDCDGTGQTLAADPTGLLDYVEVYCGCTAGVALHAKDDSAADEFAEVLADTDDERSARLRGLRAMLELPETRGLDGEMRKRVVEIEVTEGVWARVASVIVEDKRVTFLSAIGVEYLFVGGRIPKWRMAT